LLTEVIQNVILAIGENESFVRQQEQRVEALLPALFGVGILDMELQEAFEPVYA
jgi:hypothetical protein